jgi:hypothetical protein
METCEPLDTIFDEIDLLEDDPPHRGVAMRNARFRPDWIQAEEKELQGLWEKGVFKKWSRKDLRHSLYQQICLQAQTVCNNRRGLA